MTVDWQRWALDPVWSLVIFSDGQMARVPSRLWRDPGRHQLTQESLLVALHSGALDFADQRGSLDLP